MFVYDYLILDNIPIRMVPNPKNFQNILHLHCNIGPAMHKLAIGESQKTQNLVNIIQTSLIHICMYILFLSVLFSTIYVTT